MSARHLDDEVDGMCADRLPFGLRQLRPIEAALAVHRRCTHATLGEWPGTAHGPRHIDARQLDDGKRIARGVLHGVVTVHGGDTDEISCASPQNHPCTNGRKLP
jgi:hypothetical protein